MIKDYLRAEPFLTIDPSKRKLDHMERAIEKRLETKYEEQTKGLRKELLLMKLNQCLNQLVLPDLRPNAPLNGIKLSPKQQYEYFIEYYGHKKSTKKEDLELLKEMLDNGEIEDYEEELYESIQLTEKFHERWNEYNKLGKIDFNESIVSNQWFDKDDNLIIEFKKNLHRENLVLPPPLKDNN